MTGDWKPAAPCPDMLTEGEWRVVAVAVALAADTLRYVAADEARSSAFIGWQRDQHAREGTPADYEAARFWDSHVSMQVLRDAFDALRQAHDDGALP